MFTKSFLKRHCKNAQLTTFIRSMTSLARRRKGANEADCAKSAIKLVIKSNDTNSKVPVSDALLHERLNNLDVSNFSVYLFHLQL